MEDMREGFSIPSLIKCMEEGEQNSQNTTGILHEILISKNVDDVAAMPIQLLELLKDMPQTIQKYMEEANCCRNISETLKKTRPMPSAKRLL